MAVSFMEGYNLPYGKIMATSTLIVIPVLIFALLASKQLVRGLTMGAGEITCRAFDWLPWSRAAFYITA